jgi:hypothetical protein
VLTDTIIVPLPVPDEGLSVSQPMFSLEVHVSVPPPALLTLKVLVDGLPPPCVAVKERLIGLMPRTGVDGGGEGLEVFEGATIWASPGISDINR